MPCRPDRSTPHHSGSAARAAAHLAAPCTAGQGIFPSARMIASAAVVVMAMMALAACQTADKSPSTGLRQPKQLSTSIDDSAKGPAATDWKLPGAEKPAAGSQPSAGGTGTASSTDAGSLDDTLNAAAAKHALGDFPGAASLLEPVITEGVADSRYHVLYARCLARQNKAREAVAALRQAHAHGASTLAVARSDPDFSLIKESPAWRGLIAELEAEADGGR